MYYNKYKHQMLTKDPEMSDDEIDIRITGIENTFHKTKTQMNASLIKPIFVCKDILVALQSGNTK